MARLLECCLLFLSLILFVNLVTSQDSFYDRTISGLEVTERLYCTNYTTGNAYPNFSEPIAWMLPNLTVIYGNSSDEKFTFEDNSWTLAIGSVAPSDLGFYHCMMETEEKEWFLVKLGLNARGPFYINQWDVYWLNTVIGISAAAGFMLIVVALFILCRVKPHWFDAWNNGGASNKIDPYDDGSSSSSSSDDVEKKVGLHEAGSVKDAEEKGDEKSLKETGSVKDGKTNTAFVDEEDTQM